jgi:hypothetical protein
MARNMVWDGMFYAATLVLTLIGVLLARGSPELPRPRA